MSDDYQDLHGKAYEEWKQHQADEYIEAQRRAFLDGFESAVNESQNFRLLREWIEEERDEANRKYKERGDDMMFARKLAFEAVLVKLYEMGCAPEREDKP